MEAKTAGRAKNGGGGCGSRGGSPRELGRGARCCRTWAMDERGGKPQRTQPWGLAAQ